MEQQQQRSDNCIFQLILFTSRMSVMAGTYFTLQWASTHYLAVHPALQFPTESNITLVKCFQFSTSHRFNSCCLSKLTE